MDEKYNDKVTNDDTIYIEKELIIEVERSLCGTIWGRARNGLSSDIETMQKWMIKPRMFYRVCQRYQEAYYIGLC